ncbi:MAG: hypothetical protein JXB10_14135 [Pirellulales bacterium]|nr:hypothetical protein [Pirellulales bacterium]
MNFYKANEIRPTSDVARRSSPILDRRTYRGEESGKKSREETRQEGREEGRQKVLLQIA